MRVLRNRENIFQTGAAPSISKECSCVRDLEAGKCDLISIVIADSVGMDSLFQLYYVGVSKGKEGGDLGHEGQGDDGGKIWCQPQVAPHCINCPGEGSALEMLGHSCQVKPKLGECRVSTLLGESSEEQ